MKSKCRKLLTLALRPQTFVCQVKHLFILSHMRSRSSLLSHILGSNDGVAGHSELHQSYTTSRDILMMRARVSLRCKSDISGKYLLDKLLHNNQVISRAILNRPNVKLVFLLRNPQDTMKSIIGMMNITGDNINENSKVVLKYYRGRLLALENYAVMAGNNACFIESDSIIHETNDLLSALSEWLCLESQLEPTYTIFENTGLPGHGDPFGNIMSGKVVSTQSLSDVSLSSELIQEGESAYHTCRKILSDNCRTIL